MAGTSSGPPLSPGSPEAGGRANRRQMRTTRNATTAASTSAMETARTSAALCASPIENACRVEPRINTTAAVANASAAARGTPSALAREIIGTSSITGDLPRSSLCLAGGGGRYAYPHLAGGENRRAGTSPSRATPVMASRRLPRLAPHATRFGAIRQYGIWTRLGAVVDGVNGTTLGTCPVWGHLRGLHAERFGEGMSRLDASRGAVPAPAKSDRCLRFVAARLAALERPLGDDPCPDDSRPANLAVPAGHSRQKVVDLVVQPYRLVSVPSHQPCHHKRIGFGNNLVRVVLGTIARTADVLANAHWGLLQEPASSRYVFMGTSREAQRM